MPTGPSNWPSPVPPLPNVATNVPVSVNSSMRLFPVSTTSTCPSPVSATPDGKLNCPAAPPRLPQIVMKLPHGVERGVEVGVGLAVGVGVGVSVDVLVGVAAGVVGVRVAVAVDDACGDVAAGVLVTLTTAVEVLV